MKVPEERCEENEKRVRSLSLCALFRTIILRMKIITVHVAGITYCISNRLRRSTWRKHLLFETKWLWKAHKCGFIKWTGTVFSLKRNDREKPINAGLFNGQGRYSLSVKTELFCSVLFQSVEEEYIGNRSILDWPETVNPISWKEMLVTVVDWLLLTVADPGESKKNRNMYCGSRDTPFRVHEDQIVEGNKRGNCFWKGSLQFHNYDSESSQ